MTLGEAFIQGIETTVLGMVTIFVVLAILMAAINIMKHVFYKPVSQKSEAELDAAPVQENTEDYSAAEDEEELIAVLTAAVAASLNTSTYNLKIKSYRRIDKRNTAWNSAGIADNIDSRF